MPDLIITKRKSAKTKKSPYLAVLFLKGIRTARRSSAARLNRPRRARGALVGLVVGDSLLSLRGGGWRGGGWNRGGRSQAPDPSSGPDPARWARAPPPCRWPRSTTSLHPLPRGSSRRGAGASSS